MVRWVFSALLRNGVLMGGPFEGYVFIFYFFFILEKFLNIYGLLESLSAYFKKALINPIHSGLDIAV